MSSNESSPHSAPEETDCLVCGSGKTFTHNQILFCDGPGCDIPVHQNCYGVKVVPEGNWYCQRCEDRIPINNTPSCCCPQKSGAFKRTTIPNQYIHAACARFHPGLNHNEDPITFSSALAGKQICCICKSDYGICAPCTADSCSRVLHATCAQNESLMISGKRSRIYCDVHRDIGALSKIMKRHRRRDSQSANSSNSGSAFHRSSKRSKSYRESSSDEDHDDDEDDYESESDDEEIVDPLAEDEDSELKDKHRRNKSTASSSASSTTGSRGHTRGNRSQDSTDRRRRDRSSDSEEIDVDETEAVLGSSAGGGGRATTQRKKIRTAQSGTKESAAESQRRRLLMTLDKSKKKQGPGGLSSLTNLTNMPIRTLGGVGPPASSPVLGGGPLGESRQKLPGISRHGYNTNSSSGADSPSNPYTAGNNLSPSVGLAERFQGGGLNQSNGRGSVDFKSSVLGSAVSSPISSSFSNSGSPNQPRLTDKQQHSPRSGGGASAEETREMQATIQSLSAQVQQLQQQLGASNININSTMFSGAHTAGPSAGAAAGGADLQQKFDSLQHAHGQEKMRNLTLRQNLRDVFGFLQVPVVGQEAVEWNPDRLDEYVQALRNVVVRPDATATRPPLDAKRRNMIVDRVLKEMDV